MSCRVVALGLVLGALCGLPALADGPPATQPAATQPAEEVSTTTPAAPAGDATGASFELTEATIWLGGTRVLPFHVEPVDRDRTFVVSAEPSGVLEVSREPAALAGHSTGFLRVRGAQPGRATLQVGGAAIAVEVKDDPVRSLAERAPRPTIVTPAREAIVWGRLTIGVELPATADEPEAVTLALPGGAVLKPVEALPAEHAPSRLYAFELDAYTLPPGPMELVPTVRWQGGTTTSGDAVLVHVVRPDAPGAAFLAAEAESQRDAPRPERYFRKEVEKQPPLNTAKSESASGGEFVVSNGSFPPLAIPVTAERGGWHQLVVTAGSDFALGAYPTVGLRTNEDNDPSTGTRLARSGWHRVAVGRPVWLDAGTHSVVAMFENDANAKGSDRNLRIDRYELLRVDTLPAGDRRIATPGGDDRLRVAVTPNLHGRVLGGGVALEAKATAAERFAMVPAELALVVNGKRIATQRGTSARFVLDRGHLAADAASRVWVEARLANGFAAATPAAEITLSPYAGGAPVARSVLHFAADDPAWDDTMRASLGSDKDRKEPAAIWHSASSGTLRLPDDLAGDYDLQLIARGEAHQGPPLVRLTLKQGEAEVLAKEVGVAGGFRSYDAGTLPLAAGPKTLRLEFNNDHYEGAGKDRNVFIAGVTLMDRVPADTAAPTVRVAWPGDGETFGDAGVVIADTADDRAVVWAELLIDGVATGMRVKPTAGDTRVVLPFAWRGDAAARAVAVRVSDEAGNVAESTPVQVTRSGSDEPTRYERALRLLDRFAFGPEPRELAAVLTMGEEAYLRDRLFRGWSDAGEQLAWTRATLENPSDRDGGAVERRALLWAMTSPNPVRARLTLWTANHFSTWQRKAEAHRKAEEFARLAAVGPAPFLDLLQTSATSPAMLVYLDQHRSYAGRINENYAREIMELHTLGVRGGYAQADVTALAHLLTGWTIAEEAPVGGGDRLESTFRFAPPVNDEKPRDVFGMRFPEAKDAAARFDRVRLATEMLASHPATARYIAQKLAEHYVALPAPPKLVDDLAATFLRTGGDLREVLLAMSRHEAFWSSEPRLTRPLDYALRLSRTTGHENAGNITGYLNRSAVGLFDRDTPDGYPEEDVAYTDSNITLQRWRLAGELDYRLLALVPEPMRTPPKEGDASGWRQGVVDAVAMRLLGEPLSPASNEAVVKVMTDSAAATPQDLVRSVAAMVAQMPEANLR